MLHVLPTELGNVDESIHATKVHEGTEVHHRGHDTLAALAGLQVGEEVPTLLLLRLFEPCTTRQHHVVAVAVEFDDLGLDGLADVGLELAHSTEFHQRCGEESTQTNVDDEATLDHFDDRAGNHLALVLELFNGCPGALVLRTLLGQDEATFLVLLLEHQGFNLVTEADDVGRVDVVANGELSARDDTLGLEANVEEHFVVVDLDDRTLDEVAVIELLNGAHEGCFELGTAEIIGSDLPGDVVAVCVEGSHRLWRQERCALFGHGGLPRVDIGCAGTLLACMRS